jgi:hypothetical protein
MGSGATVRRAGLPTFVRLAALGQRQCTNGSIGALVSSIPHLGLVVRPGRFDLVGLSETKANGYHLQRTGEQR